MFSGRPRQTTTVSPPPELPSPSGSITNALVERVRDPFLFALALAAMSWNWRFVYIVLRGGTSAVETIGLAHSQIRPYPLLVPIVFAVVFVALHPWIRGSVAALRAYADVASDNWRRRIVERGALMVIAEWREHSEYVRMSGRIAHLEQALDFALERLRMGWIERRPGGAAAPGAVVVERLAQAQQFEGFAVLTKQGLLCADERTILLEAAPQIAYVLDALPGCRRAVVATPSSLVPMAGTTADVGGIALLSDGRQVEFPGPKPPPNAVACVHCQSGSWGLFEAPPRS
jgi:hypothetical protein